MQNRVDEHVELQNGVLGLAAATCGTVKRSIKLISDQNKLPICAVCTLEFHSPSRCWGPITDWAEGHELETGYGAGYSAGIFRKIDKQRDTDTISC